jgi:hypothetical protein
VLETLIEGRLTFAPKADKDGEYYEIPGLAALPQIVNGKTLPNVASPKANTPFLLASSIVRQAA